MKDPCNFGGSFQLSHLVLVDLSTNCFQEFLLLPTLIFNFLFDKFGEFPGVDGIGGQDLVLGSFLLGEWFRGDWDVFGIQSDLFENSDLEFLALLVLDEFDLSLEKSDVLLVPLEGFEDVLIQFVCGILAFVFEG